MNILVTGGSGFVGTHLIKQLLECSDIGAIFSLDMVKPMLKHEKVSYIQHDIRKPLSNDLVHDRIGCIINLAAVHKTPGHERHEYFETNILGSRQVCKFASDTGVPNIIFTSSIAVYGPGEDEKTEESLQMPTIPYGMSKVIAESVHHEWLTSDLARRLAIIRPAVIFGNGEGGNFTRIAKALHKGVFVYPGRKDTIKSCCYVKDVCRLIIRSIKEPERFSVRNMCYPQKITLEQICQAFHDALGYRMPRMKIPRTLVNSAATIARVIDTPFIRGLGLDPERIAKLVNSTNISSHQLVASGFEFKYDLKAALKDWANDCGREPLF